MQSYKTYAVILSIIVLLQASLFITDAHAFAEGYWDCIFQKPFTTQSGDSKVNAITEFKGLIYAAVGRGSPESANVYRLIDDKTKTWQLVTPPWPSNTDGYVMRMCVFDGHLYVSTWNDELWRTADGTTWVDVATSETTGWGGSPLTVYDGQLYLGPVYSPDGVNWYEPTIWPMDAGFNDLSAMEVYDGFLYAGVGVTGPSVTDKGIQIWRTQDGDVWSLFKEEKWPPLSTGLPEHVHAMKTYKGHLYIGHYHGTDLFRTDGNLLWETVIADPPVVGGGVFRLEEHCGRLYMGQFTWQWPPSGTEYMLYSSRDGLNWEIVPEGGARDADTNGVGSLYSYRGNLYVGYIGNESVDGYCEIFVRVFTVGGELVGDEVNIISNGYGVLALMGLICITYMWNAKIRR